MAVVRSPAILGKDAVSAEAIRGLPEESIMTLFGQTRTSLITLAIETSKDGMKEYTRLRDVAEKARKSGTGVPGSFCPELVFYHFQQDHGAILRRTPLPVAKVETWLYGFGRVKRGVASTRVTRRCWAGRSLLTQSHPPILPPGMTPGPDGGACRPAG